MNDSSWYIMQPLSDQSLSIMRLLKSCERNIRVEAVLDEDLDLRRKCLSVGYDGVVYSDLIPSARDLCQLVPTGAHSTEKLLRSGEIILGSVVMDPSCLRVFNKPWFIEHCTLHDVPVPRTTLSFSSLRKDDFPVFFKEKHERGGGVRGVAYSADDLPSDPDSRLIYQEYINTPGTYGVGFISKDGVIKASFCHHEKHSYPKDGGSAVVIEPMHDQRLLELTQRAIKSLSYSGWGLAEFKYCPFRRDYVIMEINAKFWASCELAFRSDPRFLNLLFSVTRSKERIAGLFFLNRALAQGFVSTVRLRARYARYKLVRYPGAGKSFAVGLGFPLTLLRATKALVNSEDRVARGR